MYKISSQSTVLGYTDAPTYCYKLPSGSPQVIGRKERARGATATGLIHGGVVYSLPGHADFDAETASVSEIDAGTVLNAQRDELAAQQAAQSDTDEQTVDLAYRVSLIELGVN